MQRNAQTGHSEDTEILTRRGWIPISDVTDQDHVAARTPDGTFKWEQPTDKRVCDHEGEYVWFHGKQVDALVAPGHHMLWSREGSTRIRERISPAQEIESLRGACLVATSRWDAPDLATKTFEPMGRAARGPASATITMTGDQFAAFMGMYIAEGCALRTANDWRVCIAQSEKGKGYDEFRELLAAIVGKDPCRTGHAFVLWSRALVEYLGPLGKAKSKRIPRDVLDLSQRQLAIFWRYYWLGDGSLAHQQEVVATASRAMAGDLQEVIQKLGRSAAAREVKVSPTKLVPTSGVIYKLGVRNTLCPEYRASQMPGSRRTIDIRIPSQIMYTRRNGKPAWSGN